VYYFDMDELEIDGKKYLSSKRAAREHKYHIDYIGQLIRAGKVHGKKVGRSWYVEESSLKSYLLAEAGGQATPALKAQPAPMAEPEAPRVMEPVVVASIEEEAAVAEVPQPVQPENNFASSLHHQPMARPVEERVVHFSSPIVEKKASTLTYIEESEPMLPVLEGRTRSNADFVAIPMRKISEPEQEEIESAEYEEADEEADAMLRPATHAMRSRKSFAMPRMQVLAAIGLLVLAVAAIGSSLLATSIKVTDGGAASVGLTIK